MNSIEPKITISQKIEGNNLIMASSSTWSGNSNFLMKSQNSSKGVSKKKMSFTPQPTTSTVLPTIDLISFDQVVSSNINKDFGSISLTKSLNEDVNPNFLNSFKIFDKVYPNLKKSIYSFARKHSKKQLPIQTVKKKKPSLVSGDKNNKKILVW